MSKIPASGDNKLKIEPSGSPPAGPNIADAFQEYINNEIPSRLIDTLTLRFIPRKDVLLVFQDKIADVTEEQIQKRINQGDSDPFVSYQPRRETVLRQIIQEIVEYDILSHRWDEVSGEPTYQDISAGKQSVSKFNKLVQFCKTSRQLGRKLAWVDTCCIDKRNAAELTEAIHGMYKWYAHSYLCIVHLAESTSCADWSAESWFKRGWTLQELLAPKRLKFYDKNWKPFAPLMIDDDRHFGFVTQPLERVTGISKAVLTADHSYGVYGRSFWEIMSWASRRQTTRIEDRAYSLIGLFRVSMTIAYGEGQRAFPRLVEAIAAKKPSWDILAWFGQPSADHFALPTSPASYHGFKPDMAKNRPGVEELNISAHGLTLKSLPPIPMELSSVKGPEGLGRPFVVCLKPRSIGEGRLGRYSDLVVECGLTRFKTVRDARQLAACIINHHAARKRGKMIVGKEYVCLLLYSEDGEDEERTWMKLATDNPLRITCLGVPDATSTHQAGIARPDEFPLSLETTYIQSSSPLN